MADRVGQQLGKYRLLSLLGKGGFAEVYLGQQVDTGMQVAIKVLHAVLTGADVDQFRAEAEIIARLAHPNIVRLLEFDTDQGTPFLVMEFAPNRSLRERHPRGTPLPLDWVIAYAKQVADALQYAHNQKLIHRDIKPENLLIGADERILLSDFGIATVAKSSTSQSTQDAMGTVTYMAPEQIQGKPRPVSDQYALGVVVYEWLTGEPPFEGSFTEIATQHLFTPPQPPHEKNPSIIQAVEQVLLTCLTKDPHQRFPSVGAFANALEQARQGIAPVHFATTRQVTPSGPIPVSTGSLPTVQAATPGSLPTVPAAGGPPAPGSGATPNSTAPTSRAIRWSAGLIVVLLAVLLIGVAGTVGVAYVVGRSQSSSFSVQPTDTPSPTFTPTPTPRPTNTPRPTATPTPGKLSVSPTGSYTPGACNTGWIYPTQTWRITNTGGKAVSWYVTWSGGSSVTIDPPTQGQVDPGQTVVVRGNFSIYPSTPKFTIYFWRGSDGGPSASITYYCT